MSLKSKLFLDDKSGSKKNTIKINEKLIARNNEDNEYMSKIKEFLAPSFDENDFDDVVSKDKRTFCQFFCEKFQNNQIFMNFSSFFRLYKK